MLTFTRQQDTLYDKIKKKTIGNVMNVFGRN